MSRRTRWMLLGVAGCTLTATSLVGRERTGSLEVDAGERLRWIRVGQHLYFWGALLGFVPPLCWLLLAPCALASAATCVTGAAGALAPVAAEVALRQRTR